MMELLSDNIVDIDLLERVIEALDNMSSNDGMRIFKELKNCDYNVNAYNIAVDEDVLSKRTLEEQIKLMKDMRMGLNQPEKVTHSKNMMKISDVTEFKAYLKELKQKLGKDADVKSDTVVFKFTPDRKKGRKEN